MNHLVISFISPDKPGLVDKLSHTIKQYQGNWQTSSLHHLSGFFAGIIEVAVDEGQTDALKNALNNLPNFNVTIEVATALSPKSPASLVLELTANDRPGIIQEISSVIHQQGGNLLKLVSSQESAPHSGQDLFKAKATITINKDALAPLVTQIESLADDLMVDISH
ncbi:glycine cleavage system protein R [Thalassotalea piscium]|uniref:Glycine cleavage system transcriptional repressor n=1 Tax=Thalassotalea piscium TaxID=1230533 RepID=A0A7X0NHU4_9GAMM|nr:ACT domain-containing protein [Thalassotalea piscium]MBB6543591.1 glycine cleavage system regulatory protein [Thalassotalea piscium]